MASLTQYARAEAQREEADRQRSQAVLATTEANRQRALATTEWEAASEARREAEYRAFTSAIRAADAELNLNNAGAAARLLMTIPGGQRGWEWHHLYLRTNPSLVNLASPVPCAPPGEIESFPTIISDHVVTVEGGRIYLRRCATLVVWDRQRETRVTHDARGKILAVSAMGEVLAMATTRSGTAVRWTSRVADPVTGRVVNTLGPFSAEPICADFNPNGTRLAIGFMPLFSQRGEPLEDFFDVWDVPSARRLLRLAPDKPPLFDTRARFPTSCLVAFSPDSSRLATSGARVHVWRSDTGEELVADPTQAGHVGQPVAWDAYGSRLAIGRLTGLVDILDLTSAPRLDRLDGDGIIRAQPLPDGDRRILVTARKKNEVLSIAFSQDGTKVATGRDVSVVVWDLTQRKLAKVLDGHRAGVIGVAFNSTGQIVSADWSGLVNVWPATSTVSAAINVLPGSASPTGEFALSENGAVVGVAQTDGGLFAWRLSDFRKTVFRPGSGQLDLQNLARSLAISPDGNHLFAGELDAVGTIRPWALGSGRSGPPLQLNAQVQPGCENLQPAAH